MLTANPATIFAHRPKVVAEHVVRVNLVFDSLESLPVCGTKGILNLGERVLGEEAWVRRAGRMGRDNIVDPAHGGIGPDEVVGWISPLMAAFDYHISILHLCRAKEA